MLRSIRLMFATLFAVIRARLTRGPLRPEWSFMFEGTVAFLRRDWDDTAAWPFARLRAEMDARPSPKDFVRRVEAHDQPLGGVPAVSYVPRAVRHRGVVLFFHGGSYIFGSARTTHAELLARLAVESGTRVVGPDYRLAPEHPFPAQRDDALAVFDALVAGGIAPGDIVLAGDSAGGNLALVVAMALRDRGGPQPAALALVSPWIDLTMPGATYETNAAYDYGTRDGLVQQAKAFAGDVPLDDPRVSPTYGRLDGLPPTLVEAGDAELLHDDIVALADKMKRAGVDATLYVAPGMPHNAAVFAAFHPSGRAAAAELARFVEAHLAPAS